LTREQFKQQVVLSLLQNPNLDNFVPKFENPEAMSNFTGVDLPKDILSNGNQQILFQQECLAAVLSVQADIIIKYCYEED
jgi:hypothetical protein